MEDYHIIYSNTLVLFKCIDICTVCTASLPVCPSGPCMSMFHDENLSMDDLS